jgi:hypothetical protein
VNAEIRNSTHVYSTTHGFGVVTEVISDNVVLVQFEHAGVYPLPVKTQNLYPAETIKKPTFPVPTVRPSQLDNLIEPETGIEPLSPFGLDRLHRELVDQSAQEVREAIAETLETLIVDQNLSNSIADGDEESEPDAE